MILCCMSGWSVWGMFFLILRLKKFIIMGWKLFLKRNDRGSRWVWRGGSWLRSWSVGRRRWNGRRWMGRGMVGGIRLGIWLCGGGGRWRSWDGRGRRLRSGRGLLGRGRRWNNNSKSRRRRWRKRIMMGRLLSWRGDWLRSRG